MSNRTAPAVFNPRGPADLQRLRRYRLEIQPPVAIFNKKTPKIGREAMLSSKPARNDALEWSRNEQEEVVITLRRSDTTKVKMLSKLFWVPEKRTLVLDEIGSQVWDMCDGRTTVDAMIRRLSEAHKLNLKEAEISLLTYLKNLGKKRLLGFIVEKKDLPRRPKARGSSGKAWGK